MKSSTAADGIEQLHLTFALRSMNARRSERRSAMWPIMPTGGASVALRKLVEEARRTNAGRDRARHAQSVAFRFMSSIAEDLPSYEEATRALFAGHLI
jgi:hypothetical protein